MRKRRQGRIDPALASSTVPVVWMALLNINNTWIHAEKAVESLRMAMTTKVDLHMIMSSSMELWKAITFIFAKLPGASILTESRMSWILGICCFIFVAGTSKYVRLLLSSLAATSGIFYVLQKQDEMAWFMFAVAGMACLTDVLQCMETGIYSYFVSVTKCASIIRITGTLLMLLGFGLVWILRQLLSITAFSVFPAFLIASRMPHKESCPDLNIHNVILTLAGLEINSLSLRALDLVMFAGSVLCLEATRQITIAWLCTDGKIDNHIDITHVHELTHFFPIHENMGPFLHTPCRGDYDGQEKVHNFDTPFCGSGEVTPPTPHTGNPIVNNCYFYNPSIYHNDDDDTYFSPLSPDSTIDEGHMSSHLLHGVCHGSGISSHSSDVSVVSIGKKLQTRKMKIRSSGGGLAHYYDSMSESSLSPCMNTSISTMKKETNDGAKFGVKVVEPQGWDNLSGCTSLETRSIMSQSFSDDSNEIPTVEVVVDRSIMQGAKAFLLLGEIMV